MDASPNSPGLDVLRVVSAVILCLTVPWVALYAAFALNSGQGLVVGLVPLVGALLLLGTGRRSEGTRVGLSIAAFLGTIVYSIAVVSMVVKAVAH